MGADTLWMDEFPGYGLGAVMDDSSNIFMYGMNYETGTLTGFARKYNGTGGLEWEVPGDILLNAAQSMSVSTDSNIYVLFSGIYICLFGNCVDSVSYTHLRAHETS